MEEQRQGITMHPAFGDNAVEYSLQSLSGWPDERVAQTVSIMTQYAVEDAKTPEIQEDAQTALALGGGDPLVGVWRLAKERFAFQEDTDTAGPVKGLTADNIVEVIIRPVDLSRMYRRSLQPVEDCDGYSGYIASLLTALSIPCSFCTVAVDPTSPSEYSHVYVVSYKNNDRVAIDASHGPYPGWECPNPFGKRREWVVEKVHPFIQWAIAGSLAALVLWMFNNGGK